MAFTIVGDAAVISGDTQDTKPAAVFKGGDTDDAYSFHSTAVAMTAANHSAGTVTAWINIGDKTSTCAIFSINDADAVEYIDFKVVAGKLTAACTDATVAQWSITSPAVNITPHKWTHVALVQDGVRPFLYVNGVKVLTTDTTMTTPGTWSAALDGVDKGWIGASSIGGAGAVGEEFVGAIADVKYYATAHTDDEIYNDYMGLVKTGAYARWQLDGDLVNSGSEGTAAVAVSDAYLTPTYNEFISKLRAFIVQGTLVVADAAGFSDVNGKGSALFINAA